ncbi:TonB-dependent receptor [Aquimarina spongiae]|uniref:TonB-dependent Receptor Plug Domain n=1 Tax=Aquimarina spongiae TaxID=570521 RepID=A0A1M6K5D0_9FLAO|nr:carboxypeptidase-like regulatory domain-containing protein [Aquimarina spongiae]SHJ54168.1 TonB-dependent Receptor Plug Domain [Aquimarina spongiae]
MIKKVQLHSKRPRNKTANIFCLGVLLFFLGSFIISGQEDSNTEPLSTVFTVLEKRFEYKFTFANEIIEGVRLVPPPENLSFEETLSYLKANTNLTFTIINQTFVSVNKDRTSLITICGQIRDIETGKGIEGAEIIGTPRSTISNENGFFQIEVSASNVVFLINHIGYQPLNFAPDQKQDENCEEILLTPQTFNLQEVILKNYITKGIGKTDTGALTIDYSNFGSLPGLIEADVLQTIQALPGVQSVDETVSNINVRGGTHDQNLILWDGIKMYQSGHFFGLISVFNPNITAKASLLKNGTSPEHSGAVSSTIVMNSQKNINDTLSFGFGANLINVDGFIDIPTSKKSSLQISARKSISNLYETPTYSRYFDRIAQDNELDNNDQNVMNSDFEFDFYDTNLRWNYHISENDKVRLNFLLINNDLVFSENATINNIETSRQSNISQNSIAAGIWYHRKWSDKFESSIQLYETNYELKATNVNLLQTQRFLQKNVVSETGVTLKTIYKLNQNLSLLNGYQFVETGITNLNDIDTPIFVDQEVRVVRNHGVFSELIYKPQQKSKTIHLGVRYSFIDKFNKHIIEPRLSYNQKLNSYWSLEILGEMKHQTSSQIINFQNDFLGIENRRWFLSDEEEIPIVTSNQVSIGLQYNKKGWLIAGETYYKKVNDITARSQGFQNKFEFQRGIGDYAVSGLDVLVNKRFENISTWLSYSFADNNYTFNTFEDTNFPNNTDITHAITFGSSYTLRGFKLSAGINWNSGLPTTQPLTADPVLDGNIDFGEANADRLKNYFRFDISAIYDFQLTKNIKAHAGASIWNLTNNRNVIGNYYRLNDQNIPLEMTKSALRLTPNAVFRISF